MGLNVIGRVRMGTINCYILSLLAYFYVDFFNTKLIYNLLFKNVISFGKSAILDIFILFKIKY